MPFTMTLPTPVVGDPGVGTGAPASPVRRSGYSDVRLFATPDGGEISVNAAGLVLGDGLESAVYLSMFGGNAEDGGGDGDSAKQWWGNLAERNADARLRSETQAILRGLPAIPANLVRLEEAVLADLAWMTKSLASDVSAQCSMPALNRVAIAIRVVIADQTYTFVFEEIWGARAA